MIAPDLILVQQGFGPVIVIDGEDRRQEEDAGNITGDLVPPPVGIDLLFKVAVVIGEVFDLGVDLLTTQALDILWNRSHRLVDRGLAMSHLRRKNGRVPGASRDEHDEGQGPRFI
mgnify:CR=1 FL=1